MNSRSKTNENIFEIYFRNNLEGFIIGTKGAILHTLDSGQSWHEQNSDINTSLHKMSLDEKVAVLLDWNGKIWINAKAEDKWTSLAFKGSEIVDDVLVWENWLFIISSGKLYRTQI